MCQAFKDNFSCSYLALKTISEWKVKGLLKGT